MLEPRSARLLERRSVVGGEEYVLAVIAALRDVVRNVRNDNAGRSGHGVDYNAARKRVSIIGDCPWFR